MGEESTERFTALPTAEEYALLREAYAETYPVRPLLNAIDAKDAEIERLQMLLDASLKRLGENDEEIMRLRAVAVAAKALVQTAHDCVNHDGHDVTAVEEPALTALETALASAGYDSEHCEHCGGTGFQGDEACEFCAASGRTAVETSAVPGPQLCTCRDGARYRFIRQGEDRLDTLEKEILAAVWNDIGFKGCWRERMDKRIDEAMQQLKQP